MKLTFKDKYRLLKKNKFIFFLFISLPLIIILNSSTELFCTTPVKDRIIPLSNYDIFFMTLIIFVISNVIILSVTLYKKNLFKYEKILDLFTFVIQSIIVIIIITIFLEMTFMSYYTNYIISFIIYLVFLSSIGILLISFIKFSLWYLHKKSLLILLYGSIMLFLAINTFISLFFISQNVSFLGSPVIYNNEFHTSCSMMLASNKSTNPYNLYISLGQEHYLEIPYNTTLILSFILTWITSVLILKQYSLKIGKIRYWTLVSLPLIFFTMRYIDYFENFIIYFNLLDLLPIYIELITYIENSPFYLLIKFNLLFGSLFFSMVFITIYSKLPKETMLRNTVLISALGMFLLFSSREIIGLFLPSYPPLGIMTVAFMAISSYLFFMDYLVLQESSQEIPILKNGYIIKLNQVISL